MQINPYCFPKNILATEKLTFIISSHKLFIVTNSGFFINQTHQRLFKHGFGESFFDIV
jgi:hypothetical protein